MNKVENLLIRNVPRFFEVSYNKPMQKLGLLQEPLSPHKHLHAGLYTRSFVAVSLALPLLDWLAEKVYFLLMIYNALSWHRIQKHFYALLHVVFAPIKEEYAFMFLVLLLEVSIYAICLFFSILAWNRRADRLNREPIMPMPVPAAADVPGVWPPPPPA